MTETPIYCTPGVKLDFSERPSGKLKLVIQLNRKIKEFEIHDGVDVDLPVHL